MEVDSPTSTSSNHVATGGTSLKRSNSAPMINLLVSAQPDMSPVAAFKPASSTAVRRLSSSNLSLQNPAPPASPPIRPTNRIAKLKQEEIHIADKEKQHEKETQSSLWISNNWGRSLAFDHPESMDGQSRRPRSYSESLHVMTQSNILCGSPSPTRSGIKQCFSPSMQIPVKSMTFTPSPSPSPTRKNFLRSLSPIAVRTGPMKRKLDGDVDRCTDYLSPPKKFNTGSNTPDRVVNCSHPLAYSISSSSLDNSPDSSSIRSHLSTLPGRSPLASHSPLSSSSTPSPQTSLTSDSGSGLLMPAKSSFLFRPVTETLLASPSSTSSSSSSSSINPLLDQQASNPSPQQRAQPSQQHNLQSQASQPSLLETLAPGQDPIQSQRELQQNQHINQSLTSVRLSPGHHRMSSDSDSLQPHDVYMSDSEMRDHTHGIAKTEGFKPISPDHA